MPLPTKVRLIELFTFGAKPESNIGAISDNAGNFNQRGHHLLEILPNFLSGLIVRSAVDRQVRFPQW